MKEIILAIRFLLEMLALIALGYWGYDLGKGMWMKLSFMFLFPIIMMFIWGMFISPKAIFEIPEWFRILLELSLFGIAAFGLYNSGLNTLAILFILIVIFQRIYLTVNGH